MKAEIKVCTFEQAARLFELGVSQELQPGDAYWATMSNGANRCFFLSENEDWPHPMYKPKRAFDATELGYMIIKTVSVRLPQWCEEKEQFALVLWPGTPTEKVISSTSEAIARADMLIWLLGSGDQGLLNSANDAILEMYSLQTPEAQP